MITLLTRMEMEFLLLIKIWAAKINNENESKVLVMSNNPSAGFIAWVSEKTDHIKYNPNTGNTMSLKKSYLGLSLNGIIELNPIRTSNIIPKVSKRGARLGSKVFDEKINGTTRIVEAKKKYRPISFDFCLGFLFSFLDFI